MSLTSHLADKNSSVRAYFERRFPHTRSLQFAHVDEPPTMLPYGNGAMEMTSEKIFGASPARVLPDNEAGYSWSVAGTAFDYRLRYEFEVADPNTFIAAKGWTNLVRRPMGERETDTGWQDIVDALSEVTNRASPIRGGLTPSDELDLARLCGVLALYEQVFRMGGALNQRIWETPIALVGLNAPLDRLLALIDDRLPADIAAMMTLFRSSAHELRSSTDVILNPRFARSVDLGGADGDLIVDRLLLEIKAIKVAAIGRQRAWQVLGYLLADTDDEYQIDSVGWYFARQGYLWRYPAAEFLHRLAGRDVDLANARVEFADVCTDSRRRSKGNDHFRVDASSTPVSSPGGASRGLGFDSIDPLIRRVERDVNFFPPARGRGRWHAPRFEVPWLQSLDHAEDLEVPSCGASMVLNLGVESATPPIGIEQRTADKRFCRRCLQYTEGFYGSPYNPHSPPELASLQYYPPKHGSGKWHVRAGATGYFHFGQSDDDPACHTPVELNLAVKPLCIPTSGDINDADPRLCRKCLRTPPKILHADVHLNDSR